MTREGSLANWQSYPGNFPCRNTGQENYNVSIIIKCDNVFVNSKHRSYKREF